MSKPKWTKQDSARAIKEGWEVFNDSLDRPEIKKYDETTPFEYDENALEFVLRQAKRRKHCRKAIKIVYGF